MTHTPGTDKKHSEQGELDDRLWLDKQCLEPIISMPGRSRLCNACLQVLRECRVLKYLKYRTTLSISADRGCRLCMYLLDQWDKYKEKSTHKLTGPIDSEAYGRYGPQLFGRMTGVGFWMSTVISVTFDFVDPAFDPVPYLNHCLKCSVSTSSPGSQSLAKWWLRHCLRNHAHCRSDTTDSKKIPARLIHIKPTDHAPALRLVETGGQSREERDYMTLSYCWGDALFPTLRTDNEQQLKNGIAFETLPKAFQDAIYIAGWFHVTYLWIDSLCILQDSHDDWISESCKMKDIYKNSFLTVAATAASDPSRGCFRDRIPSLIERIKFCASNETSRNMTIVDKHSWEMAIHFSPLSKRAWAFQERLLSPRVLHFGENQMFWECNELSACETCPGGIQPMDTGLSAAAAKGQLMRQPSNFIADVWEPIVTSYTMGALTNFSDKCIAISGIANEVHSRFGEEYIAGLWRKNFEKQLLWCERKFYKHRPLRPRVSYSRPTTYVAPSWSWLSVDGPVALNSYIYMPHILLEVINIEIELLNNNLSGTIKSGRIQARGWLSAGTWQQDCDTSSGALQSILGHPCGTHDIEVELDTAAGFGEGICLPVGSGKRDYDDEASYHGLLLAPTGAQRDEYHRIGVYTIYREARISRSEVFRPFFQQKLENGEWIDRPKTTFTIV